MKLSHYVLESQGSLINTVTQESLPTDAAEDALRAHCFLDGQEQEAVHRRLFGHPIKTIALKIIPTWACNLRCRHCFVLDKLLRDDPRHVDIEKLAEFMARLLKVGPVEAFGINLIGGEATLRAKESTEIILRAKQIAAEAGVSFTSGVTSNGTVWNREVAELFSVADYLMFSLDGHRDDHNKQRLPLFEDVKGVDLYQRTLNTIKRCVLMGFRDKMRVQASLFDECFDDEKLTNYHRDLLMAGMTMERITVGSAVPTPHKPELSEIYTKYLSSFLYTAPCCKYRVGRDFVVDASGKVYCDYFEDSDESCVGDFDTPMEELLDRHKQLILRSMPVLNDEKCKACPAIGVCWGQCCNTDFIQPSKHCNPAALQAGLRERAEDGTLAETFGLEAKRACK